uniref:phosphotransferase n=1 Tax=Dyadobacter sp. MSC1_007 TaxID=2909264 RepID=UPI00202F9637
MTTDGKAPPPYLSELLEDVIGKKSVRWTLPDCGLSSAHRFSVLFENNHGVFVKAATDDDTEQWLRNEHLALSSGDRKFMPQIIHWLDIPGIRPVLITEDLSKAYWPASHAGVTWRQGDIDLLFDGLKELSATQAALTLPTLRNRRTSIWSDIANDPASFLNLKLCSEQWLNQSISALIEAEKSTDVTGDRLVHGDMRSDNICIAGSQVIFVDWSHAARGNGRHDLASVLPTLHLEGGPDPYQLMPEGGGHASAASAMHIRRLLEDSLPEWLRAVFVRIIGIELEWAGKCLG